MSAQIKELDGMAVDKRNLMRFMSAQIKELDGMAVDKRNLMRFTSAQITSDSNRFSIHTPIAYDYFLYSCQNAFHKVIKINNCMQSI